MKIAAALLLTVVLASCAGPKESTYMRDAAPPAAPTPAGTAAAGADAKDARVVVFRPSTFGGNTQFPIFEYIKDDATLMGFAESGCYFTYRCPAGKHIFLTWGEGEAFIDATLEAGKTYYVRCFAKMGLLKPRPRFMPVTPGSEEWKVLDSELKDLKPRELDPALVESYEYAKEDRVRKAKASFDEGSKSPAVIKPADGR